MKRLRPRLTYANVVASLALFLVVSGGAAIAANQLGKNSVGSKQLKKNAVTASEIKKNAVTAAKLKKNAVTTAKVKKDAVTGAKVNEATLGAVPLATTADVANAVAPAEALRVVGTPGQPPFASGSGNFPTMGPVTFNPVGFYKDRAGIVHLEGAATVGEGQVIFTLPPGYRPAPNTLHPFVGLGEETTGIVFVAGAGVNLENVILEGMVIATEDEAVLNGISFRAMG